MATNKHAQIRYNVLDKCFSNFGRNYTYHDLLEEVNNALYEYDITGKTVGIKLRQLYYDIAYMKSDAGFSIELDENLTLKEKRVTKRLFRYKDKDFSLANHPLNQTDSEQLGTTLAIFSRYKGRIGFDWLEELIPRMELAFDLTKGDDYSVISYQNNPYLKGIEYVGLLFNQILKRKVLKIEYKPYNQEPKVAYFYPYHLKQYNSRWFLICKNEKYEDLTHYALDRINKIEETDRNFKYPDINWDEYFEDFVGVTKSRNTELKTIKLKFSEARIDYVKTKPLNGSQKPDKSDESGLTIKIEVIPNKELTQLILGYGKDVEVISPDDFRNDISETIKEMAAKY